MGEKERLAPETFRLPVEKIRESYYSDSYFALTKELLEAEGRAPAVTMQVFAKKQGLLGGVDEAVAMLKLCSGRQGMDVWEPGWERLRVSALHEGDEIEPYETVMLIEGDYTLFAHLETVYLGALARRSRVMTNVRRVVAAAGGKPILFFPARHDHWLVQTGDGWAAHVAGAIGVSTDAQASWWGGRGVGTIPHSLIASYGGDTVAAARAFCRRFGEEVNVVALVDFHNDSVADAIAVADALGEKLWGVRLDTSERLVDRGLEEQARERGEEGLRGVSVELVNEVRRALDDAGHGHVKIVASGGFTAEKIERFEAVGAPVDSYGVGSALLRGSFDFTADIVCFEGAPGAKVGRELRPNPRLEPVA
ncbi:MAG TPA: quinolinate phosphoribosyl transferase [Solirubrobacterales bacterium]|nr:quinolinate phosphoribosyl transferase [Solirubrobacterales bacterium]